MSGQLAGLSGRRRPECPVSVRSSRWGPLGNRDIQAQVCRGKSVEAFDDLLVVIAEDLRIGDDHGLLAGGLSFVAHFNEALELLLVGLFGFFESDHCLPFYQCAGA